MHPTSSPRPRRRTRCAAHLERLEARELLTAVLAADGTLTVTGTPAADTISLAVNNGNLNVTETGGALSSFMASKVKHCVIRAGAGDDVVTLGTGVIGSVVDGGPGNDSIHGGPGSDTLGGGDGNDTIESRDSQADTIDGGPGTDQAAFDSLDTVSSIEFANPLTRARDNQTQRVRVLVLNFDPLVPSEENRHLYEIFNWSSPFDLASGYESAMERDSGGAVDFDIVDWRNLNEIPAMVDGYRYTPDQYVQNRRTNTGWHNGGGTDFLRIVAEQGIVPLINSGRVDEVWCFGDHYFALPGESWMAGPGSYFINGPTYPQVPTRRAFACMGFSYERTVAEMLHNTGHRTEGTMNRVYGDWNLAHPTNNWERFSANVDQSNGAAGVGTTHWPANAHGDYDYGNARTVMSWADDYLYYPNLTFTKRAVSSKSWSKEANPDYQRDYLEWYFEHLPRAAGVNADGKQNNWYKYLYDFNNYSETGQPRPFTTVAMASDLYKLGGTSYTFQVAYSTPKRVTLATLDGQDLRVTGPNGFSALATLDSLSDATDDSDVVATYRINAPGGTWDAADRGPYKITLQAGQVGADDGSTAPAGIIGAFSVRTAAASPLPADADTLLLLHLDGKANGAQGEVPTSNAGLSYEAGVLGQAGHVGRTGSLRFANAGNILSSSGTAEFWIQTGWSGAPFAAHIIFQAGNLFNNGMALTMDNNNNPRVLQWGDDPNTAAVESSVERGIGAFGGDWTAGRWHHVAATWDGAARRMELFVDGHSVGTLSNGVRIPSFSGTELFIGAQPDSGQTAEATYDELRISGRARSAGEIFADYEAGLARAALAITPSRASLNVADTAALAATASTPVGKRDVTTQVTWTTTNSAVAVVDSEGHLRATGAGSATITAILGTLSASTTLTVTDSRRPTATLASAPGVIVPSGPSTFKVRYADDAAVRIGTIGHGDVRVVGPNGFSQFPTLVSVDAVSNGTPRVATYRVDPPGGSWDRLESGTYTIELTGFQVGDGSGRWAAPGPLGSFTVSIPALSPTVQLSPASGKAVTVQNAAAGTANTRNAHTGTSGTPVLDPGFDVRALALDSPGIASGTILRTRRSLVQDQAQHADELAAALVSQLTEQGRLGTRQALPASRVGGHATVVRVRF